VADLARSQLGQLAAIVGEHHVLTEGDAVAGYTVDWTGRFRGSTPAVVRPGSTDEVAAVVVWCAANGVAVVPQGGNTGLVGGGVPLAGEVVLSLRRLDHLDEVDLRSGQVTVGAGATLEAVQQHASAAGLEIAVDLAARGSATIGGMTATNAGGTRVLRHGPMRSQIAGIEAVVGDGSVVSHLGGLLKDNTGYDLAGLLCGSEGTLGVVTKVRLRLLPQSRCRTTVLVAVDDAAAALDCVTSARAGTDSLEAAELFFADGLALVCAHLGSAPPFTETYGAYLLLECAAQTDPTDALVRALDGVGDRIRATAVATTIGRRRELWRYREAHTEAIGATGVPHKLDVTLPLGALAEFCRVIGGAVADAHPQTTTYLFGHLGDGNIHVNVTATRDAAAAPDRVDEVVLHLVSEFGGSISAEHGIGTAKARFLHLARSPAEIATFRRIKAALDPAGILNPNALFPPVVS